MCRGCAVESATGRFVFHSFGSHTPLLLEWWATSAHLLISLVGHRAGFAPEIYVTCSYSLPLPCLQSCQLDGVTANACLLVAFTKGNLKLVLFTLRVTAVRPTSIPCAVSAAGRMPLTRK